MRQPILVTGGNGTLGRGVVARLLHAGHEVRVLSRHPRPASAPAGVGRVTGELLSGEGLATYRELERQPSAPLRQTS